VESHGDPTSEERLASPKERRLRDLIARWPSLVLDVDKPAAAVVTEVGVSGGSADVVVVDAEGEITIVECKLVKNKELRRKVIGQLFEYGDALWKLDVEDFERILAAGGTASVEPRMDSARWREAKFRSTVSRNLAGGAFRLIIAVDDITEKLERTVAFINCHTPPELRFLALELPHAGEAGIQRPEAVFYGENGRRIGPRPPHWIRRGKSFLEGIPGEDARQVAEDLLRWAESEDLGVIFKRRKSDGIETGAIFTPDGERLFRIKEQRSVRVSFEALRERDWDEERIDQLLQKLAKSDARFQIDRKRTEERPEAPLESLAQENKREAFLESMEWVLETLAG